MGILSLPAQQIEALHLPAGFSVAELGNQVYRADKNPRPAEDWYRTLGCGQYVSLDLNGMATHKVDLNFPLTHDIGRFDLVTDFGCGEHLFNQAQVFITLHDLCKSGGYIAIDRPMNDFDDHGFYNIQKTLILDIVSANDYEIPAMHVYTYRKIKNGSETYIGTQLFCIMKKIDDDKFHYPNQGKYRSRLNLPSRSE